MSQSNANRICTLVKWHDSDDLQQQNYSAMIIFEITLYKHQILIQAEYQFYFKSTVEGVSPPMWLSEAEWERIYTYV